MISVLEMNGKTLQFHELTQVAHGVMLDVRYAREDNFIGRKVYPESRVFLLRHVAKDLLKVHGELLAHGFGLLLHDGYRPWSVSKFFWDLSDESNRRFLADPGVGSAHNRGCAVDLGLYELKTRAPALMPSDFDEMNEKAHRDYTGGDSGARFHRDLLRNVMEKNGFEGIANEWWHYNHHSRHEWPVMDFTFEEILQAPKIPLPPQGL